MPSGVRSRCAFMFWFLWEVFVLRHFWSSWLWNSFDFDICEILLTFDGTTLLKGMFYQCFDAECTTLLLWHLVMFKIVYFGWRYGISKVHHTHMGFTAILDDPMVFHFKVQF